MSMEQLIGNQPIIITLDVDALLFQKLEQILQAGYSVVEINSISPDLLSEVLQTFPTLRIGAGNIVNTQQLEDCYQTGAHFITSPGFLPSMAQTAAIYSINFLPSIATMSEAMQAITLGCSCVRPYPANIQLCTILNKCLPSLRLFPAEIEWDEVEHFFNLPAVTAVSILNPDIRNLEKMTCVF